MSRFSSVQLAQPIEVFELIRAFNEDTYSNKVNLGVGAYRTENCEPWVLPVVRIAEKALANDDSLNKEYLPILGLESFSKAATLMLLGEESKALRENRAFGVQCLSGTGCLRVGAEFLHSQLGCTVFYYSKPTWGNHKLIFKNSGFTEAREYRYWSESSRGLDIEGMLEDLDKAPENSVIILHAVAHNPTGCDPTQEQWARIADVMEARKLFCFFDCAYQGFASGDLDKDAWAVRYFISRGIEMLVAQSFAKNFGLYNERIGNLTVVVKDNSLIPNLKSQFTVLIRGMYSNPPSHGARIIAYILNNPDLYEQWKQSVKTMADRIIQMRKELRGAIERMNAPGKWDHITSQIGMFSYTGLNEAQSEYMVKKHHVYMLKSGRISMAGLTTRNVEYVAQSIVDSLAHAN
ncbi:aspartate aminotransferase, cytoplasmic [Coccinella septempunctata]|uniref:aspartate aminotransferase, cytoplasmic n=1 Tax=Coccinella septempunctata TaxID=41139 RepID=UPI001D0957EA|nr:aspartate aminotransferase, cytoplasmic [Coccinella septempunctata]